MALKLSKKWTRLNLEKLDERVNPDATYGWELVPAGTPGVQAGLYFRIDGDTSGQGIRDVVTISNDTTGGFMGSISTKSADDLLNGSDTDLEYYLDVSAGEIALARLEFATGGVQPVFRGIHVVTYDGDDAVRAPGLPWAVWAEGGSGNDTLNGGNMADRLDGGTGGPVVGGVLQANDSIIGSGGSDLLLGDDGNDTLNGGTGADDIRAGEGNNSVDGGAGNDTITAGAGNDTVTTAGSGDDTINVGNGTNTVNAGEGNDTITSGTGGDTLNGEGGNDLINAGGGNDAVSGGTGTDTLNGEAGNDTISGNEDNDTISGGADDDTLSGNAGNDTVTGDAGNDTLSGNAGADNLSGGDGNDVVNGDTDDTNLQGGPNPTPVPPNGDTLNLSGNGTFMLDPTNNGFETVNIVNGPDGTPSNPALTFVIPASAFGASPPPNFSAIVNSNDTLSFANAPSGQLIDMNNLPFGLSGAGITRVNGSPFNDTIIGTTAADFINGGDGNDNIFAGGGNDTVNGQGGNDNVQGQGGNDTVSGGAGDDNVSGGAGDDTLVIEFNTAVVGGGLNLNDLFFGLDGTDTLEFRGVGVNPSSANLAAIYAYIADMRAAGMLDWGAGDNNDLLFT